MVISRGQHVAQADELLSSLGAELPAAVLACVDAAEHELDLGRQRRLLRAAAHGKVYVDDSAATARESADADAEGCGGLEPSIFVSACKTARVLNAVRAPGVGLMMTRAQYAAAGPEALLRALMCQHEHMLAMRLAEFLRLPSLLPAVVHHWRAAPPRGPREKAPSPR